MASCSYFVTPPVREIRCGRGAAALRLGRSKPSGRWGPLGGWAQPTRRRPPARSGSPALSRQNGTPFSTILRQPAQPQSEGQRKSAS